MKFKWLVITLLLCATVAANAASIARDPYLGAIVVEATTGQVLFEDNADTQGYPASMLKLMDLLLVLEKIQQGVLKLEDPVKVTKDSSSIGGSQVYLAENEVFTVDELLYALMIQSANDAATALAIHLAGSKDAFVGMMNKRAQELGMKATVFRSVHGLPPGAGQEPDVTTARDFTLLCRELVHKHPEALQYTSTRERTFRPAKPFIMRTHNNLLGAFDGCDGLKTGYFREGGFSIAATAQRKGVRVIAVVLGSTDKKIRDAKTRELLAQGFLNAPQPKVEPPPEVVAAQAVATQAVATAVEEAEAEIADGEASSRRFWILGIVLLAAGVGIGFLASRRRP